MFCHIISFGAGISTSLAILFQLGIFAMFTFEKRFTYVLRTAVGEFGAIEAQYVYMLLLCLRGYFGTKMVTAGFSITSGIVINVPNVMVVLGTFILINGTIATFKTAIEAAKKDGESRV